MKLTGKKAMIVGGGSEMAGAIIADMLENGAELFLVDISVSAMERNINALNPIHGKVKTFVADVTSQEQLNAAAAEMVRLFGKIDIMVYVAGIIKHFPILEMTEDAWKSVIDINLCGCFHACKAVAGYMKEASFGRIINISSIGGRTGRCVGCNYSASKAGIVGMSQSLALELAGNNITVNVIAPGPLKGSMFETMDPERIEALRAGIPLGRLGEMKDISPAIVYLSSDDASWVTGEVLDINGGVFI